MNKKLIFTIIFIFSLSGIQIASFKDWLILSIFIQIIWVTIISNDIVKLSKSKNRLDKIFEKFNKIFIYVLITNIIIIFFSMSFGFRIIFAPLYIPIFYISGIGIIISIFRNYYIIINELFKRASPLGKKIILILSSFLYPIGVYTIKAKETGANNSYI